MNEWHQLDLESPIGIVEIKGTSEGISSIMFGESQTVVHKVRADTPEALLQCQKELIEYFKGERMQFTVPCITAGTEFQGKVWTALRRIDFAKTASYKDIAIEIGSPNAVRAVGNANSKNKLSIIVPCHRVIGSNGKLTGYAGSIPRKEWLLQHERAFQKQMGLDV